MFSKALYHIVKGIKNIYVNIKDIFILHLHNYLTKIFFNSLEIVNSLLIVILLFILQAL